MGHCHAWRLSHVPCSGCVRLCYLPTVHVVARWTLSVVRSSCSFSRSTYNVSSSMRGCRNSVLWVILSSASKHSRLSWCWKAERSTYQDFNVSQARVKHCDMMLLVETVAFGELYTVLIQWIKDFPKPWTMKRKTKRPFLHLVCCFSVVPRCQANEVE